MAMDQGGERLDEAFEDNHDETQDWYFDLPSGAWERQEEKNRQLRANLLGKNTEPEPEKDPFTGQPVKGTGFLGRGRKKEHKPAEGSKKPVFERRGSDDERVSRFRALREGGLPQGDTWSTEPTPIDENAPLLRNRASAENAPETNAPADESRWDQMFGAPADGGSIVDAMRNWSKKPDEAVEEEPGQTADAAGEEDGSIVDSLQVWVARREAGPGHHDPDDPDDPESAPHSEPTEGESFEAATDEMTGQEPAPEFARVVDEADTANTDAAADSLMERIRARALARQEAEHEQAANAEDEPAGAWEGPGAGSIDLSKPADEPAAPAPAESGDRHVANARDESGDDGESTLEGLRAWAMSRSRRHAIEETEAATPVPDEAKDDEFEPAIGEMQAFETVSAETTADAADDESEDEWLPVEPARAHDREAPSAIAEPGEPGQTAETVSFTAPVATEDGVADAPREPHAFGTEDEVEDEPAPKKPGLLGRLFGRKPKPDPAEAAEAAAISAAAWLEEEDTGWSMSRAAATGSNVSDRESDWEPAEASTVTESATEGAAAEIATTEVDSPVDDAVSNVSLVGEPGESEVSDDPGAANEAVAYLRQGDETDSPATAWGAADMASNNDSFGWSAPQTEEEAVAAALDEEVLVTDSAVDDDDDEPDWSFLKRRHEEQTDAATDAPTWGAADMASNNDSFGWSAPQTEEETVAEALEEETLVADSAVDDDDDEPDWSFLKRRHDESTEAPADAPAWGAADMASNNDSFGWSAPQTEEEAVAEALEEETLVSDSAVDDDDDEPDWSFLKRHHEESTEAPEETPSWGAADMASNNDSFGWSAPQTEEEAVAEALQEETLVSDSAVDDDDDEPDWSFLKRHHEESTEASAETHTWGATHMASNNDSFGWSVPQTEEEAVAEALEEETLVSSSSVDDDDDEPDWSFLKHRHEEPTGAATEAPTWGAADIASNNDSFGWSAPQTEEEAVAEALEDEVLMTNSAVNGDDDSFLKRSHVEPTEAATEAPTWGAADNESAEASVTNEPTEWEWEPEVDEEPAPVPAFEVPAESPWAVPAEPSEDVELEWDPEGLDDEVPPVPVAAPFAAASLASANDEPLAEAPEEAPGMDWDWEAAAEAEANEVPTAEEPTQLGFAMPGDAADVKDASIEADEAAASIDSPAPEHVSVAPVEGANDWEAVAAITESTDDALDEFSDEPDLWAAIAEEAALEGEAGEGVADAPHATVFGQYGTRRSDEERNAEYDSQFVVAGPTDDAEEDIVLRAFEAHAATDEDEVEEDSQDFDELLGEHADAVEDDDGPAPRGGVAPAGFGSWNPPRTTNAFDEESDEWEAAEQPVPAGTAATSLPAEREYANYVGDGSFSAADQAAKRASSRTWVRELVETGLLAILVFLAVRASFQNFKVDGSSMAPTLADGQFLIVNKLVYSEVDVEKLGKYVPFVNAGDDPTRHVFHAPERGDIIVLRDPSNPSVDLIKRVVGMPGDKFEIVDGAIYVDDFLMEEPYIKSEWRDNRPAVIVPEGHYFVMGDNRDNSKDSRSSSIGFIPEDLIIGRAEFSYLPFDRFGRAPNETPILSETEGRPVLTSQRLER